VYLWPVGRHAPRVPAIAPVLMDQLLGKDICEIACGETHYAALTTNGELWAWGSNRFGQLGQFFKPSTAESDEMLQLPRIVPFAGVRIKAIACGKHHTVCLSVDGVPFAWGKNKYGQLGQGDVQQRGTPTRIPAFARTAVMLIACGPHTSGVYTEDCDVFMWGMNDTYQLGLGHNRSVYTPQLLAAPFSKSSASALPAQPLPSGKLTLRMPQATAAGKRPAMTLVGFVPPTQSAAAAGPVVAPPLAPPSSHSPQPPVDHSPSPSVVPQIVESLSLGLFLSAALTSALKHSFSCFFWHIH